MACCCCFWTAFLARISIPSDPASRTDDPVPFKKWKFKNHVLKFKFPGKCFYLFFSFFHGLFDLVLFENDGPTGFFVLLFALLLLLLGTFLFLALERILLLALAGLLSRFLKTAPLACRFFL
jgi:hypothetical protein